jgi:hypothetical protein
MHPIGHYMSLIQISNFKEDEIVCMFYDYNLYVLCIVRSRVDYTTPTQWEHMMLVAAIIVVSGGISISRRYFYEVTKLFFIHSATDLYATSVPKKPFCAS